MIAGTSRAAYEQIKSKLGDKQQAVYDAVGELGVATNEQIAEYLDWPINRVTGRVTELKKMGFVDVEGITKNKSGFSAKQWSVRNPLIEKQLKAVSWLSDVEECAA